MKVGDLISFKPIGFGQEDWSNPCIVVRHYIPQEDPKWWVVWVDGDLAVVDEENHEILHLTSSLLDETTKG